MSATTIDVVPRSRQTVEVVRLRLARQAAGAKFAGYSMAEMGKRMCRSQSWVQSIEAGKSTIGESDLALWAKTCSVSVDYLYGLGKTIGGK